MDSTSTQLPPDQLSAVWPVVLPLLEQTIMEMGFRFWTVPEIHYRLQTGAMQLWGANVGEAFLFVVTEVVQEPSGPSVQIVLGGGELDSEAAIVQHIGIIEAWAKDIGALSLVVWGRMGWKKLLRPYGYSFETALFRRSLRERMN